MALRAGFAEIDITPPVGTHKIGWLQTIVSDHVMDPLFARVAVLEDGGRQVAFIQLDTLSIRWSQVADMRRRIEQAYGLPGCGIMVSATHNHAGPAVANCGDVPRDPGYIETLVGKVVSAVGQALDGRHDAEIGFGSCTEFNVGFQRRVIMRDGTTRTYGKLAEDPDALCLEGPIDPEVAVVAARSTDGGLLGAIVNFACHPAHHGGGTGLSGGFPGVLASVMRSRGCPVTLFLNGPCANIASVDLTTPGWVDRSIQECGSRLADDTAGVLQDMTWRSDVGLTCASKTVQLPYRTITDAEVAGTVRGAQRFIDSAIYDRHMPNVVERIRVRGAQPAEVQAIGLNEHAFVGIPAEYFVEFGLRIKEQTWPCRTRVVSCANGMVGYVPTREAFRRGGYETTFAGSSRMAPEAGDLLADAAVELVTSQGR